MTVKELKQQLEKYPDHMLVFVGERMTDFTYGMVNTVSLKEISFMEEPGDEPLATYTVVVIEED